MGKNLSRSKAKQSTNMKNYCLFESAGKFPGRDDKVKYQWVHHLEKQ